MRVLDQEIDQAPCDAMALAMWQELDSAPFAAAGIDPQHAALACRAAGQCGDDNEFARHRLYFMRSQIL